MRKALFALVLVSLNPVAHATIISGGAVYENGSVFSFYFDNSIPQSVANSYTRMTFMHGDFYFSRSSNSGHLFLRESTTDEGDIFGDSPEDTWSFSGIDLTLDDYFFSPTGFSAYGGNDRWYEGYSVRANAVSSYLTVVPEPATLALFCLGLVSIGFSKRRRLIR